MTVDVYSQRDPKWAEEHYGLPAASVKSKVGAYGCGITAIAQKLTLMGWTTTPIEVQRQMLNVKAFKNWGTHNFIDWPKVAQAYPQLQHNGRHDHPNTPAPDPIMKLLYERLEKAETTIVYVDASRYERGLQQHFVLVTGRSETGDLIIMNPWNGLVQDLRPYGRTDPIAICGLILLDRNYNAAKAI